MTLKDGRKLDFTMLPGGRHPHALDVLPKHMLDVKPDIFFTLLDSFMLYPNILDADMPAPRALWWPYKSALWYPSDGGYFPQDCEKVLQKFNRPVAMSKWGQLQVKNQFGMSVDYIPHGIKTNLFVPFSDEQKRKLRMKYGKKLNRDLSNKFVVGMVARNQPRKFMDRAIKSFTLFAKGKDDVLLLLHSDANDPAQPWPVNELINRFSIGHKVEWTGMKAHEGYADSNMSEVYNLFNVKLDTTCILPDMDVTTSIGPKFIQDVKVGDKVLTSAGKYRKVLRTIPTKNWKGKILKIKADGIPELKVTTSHQIYRVPCKGMNDTKTRLRHNTRNRTTLWATGARLGRMFIDLFGKGAHNKQLPEWIMDSPKEFRKGLTEGLWKGDGCLWISRKSSKVFELQTVSKSLAHQTFNLLIAEGFRPTISSTQRLSLVWKVKITGNQDFGSFCRIEESLSQRDKSRIWSDGTNVYYPISKIEEEEYEGTVYDLTVEEEHNYICHCLVKNSGEGFGLTIIESMSCEIPVIISDYTTTKELVLDYNAGFGIKLVGESEGLYDGLAESKVTNQIVGGWGVERGVCDINHAVELLNKCYDDS